MEAIGDILFNLFMLWGTYHLIMGIGKASKGAAKSGLEAWVRSMLK